MSKDLTEYLDQDNLNYGEYSLINFMEELKDIEKKLKQKGAKQINIGVYIDSDHNPYIKIEGSRR